MSYNIRNTAFQLLHKIKTKKYIFSRSPTFKYVLRFSYFFFQTKMFIERLGHLIRALKSSGKIRLDDRTFTYFEI